MSRRGPWRALWFYGIVLICPLLVLTTLAGIHEFNLTRESNYATLWSGLLLLLIALHAYDGAAENSFVSRANARAWCVIALTMALLSFDEIGSFHERLAHLRYRLWLMPFALAVACLAAYQLFVLYRSERYRPAAKLIALGFLLFGSVAVQAALERRMEIPAGRQPIYAAIEEGTELLAMILVLKAALPNTRGLLTGAGPAAFPVFEFLRSWRLRLLLIGLTGAPLVALGTVRLPDDSGGHGLPAEWPSAAFFLLAALAALRPFLTGRGAVDWRGWILAGLALIGCTATTMSLASRPVWLATELISAGACLIWLLDSRFTARCYLPAALFLIASLSAARLLSASAVALYVSMTYVALGHFFVNSTVATASRPRQTAS